MATAPAVVPQPEEKLKKSAYQRRIDQLVKARTEAEARAAVAEAKIRELEAEKWREHVSVFANEDDAKRLLAESFNELKRWRSEALRLRKEVSNNGRR